MKSSTFIIFLTVFCLLSISSCKNHSNSSHFTDRSKKSEENNYNLTELRERLKNHSSSPINRTSFDEKRDTHREHEENEHERFDKNQTINSSNFTNSSSYSNLALLRRRFDRKNETKEERNIYGNRTKYYNWTTGENYFKGPHADLT